MHDIRREFCKQYEEPEYTDSDEDEEKKKVSIFDH